MPKWQLFCCGESVEMSGMTERPERVMPLSSAPSTTNGREKHERKKPYADDDSAIGQT